MAVECVAGTKVSASKDLCELCPAGEYQAQRGQSSCKPCRAGHACPAGSAAATPCSVGTFSRGVATSPPPPSPPPPQPQYAPVTIEEVQASSEWDSSTPASNAIDGNPNTWLGTRRGSNNWASVRVAAGAAFAYVALLNRQDQYAYMFRTVAVWRGASFGDLAHKCGEATYSAGHNAQPYIVPCDSSSTAPPGLRFITIKHESATDQDVLALAEIAVYAPLTTTPLSSTPRPTSGSSGLGSCQACAAGSYQDDSGQTGCKTCPAWA